MVQLKITSNSSNVSPVYGDDALLPMQYLNYPYVRFKIHICSSTFMLIKNSRQSLTWYEFNLLVSI